MQQVVLGVLVLHLLSALFLFYPTWRVGHWLGLAEGLVLGLSLVLFFSQALVRIVLRRLRSGISGTLVRVITAVADFFLGIAPVMLVSVLIGELWLTYGDSSILDSYRVGITALACWLLAGLYGTFKAWRPDLVHVPLVSHKLKKKLRFVQISDVHIGSRSSRFLRQVVRRVNQLEPEFLCITGDFIDQRDIPITRLAALAELTMPIYFCTGNHEHYEDLDAIIQRLEDLNVEVLRGRCVQRHGIQVLGFDDHSNPHFLRDALPTLQLDRSLFSLLLFHRPHGLEHAAAHGIDLKISGHTHNGQITPFNWLVRVQFKYLKGLYRHDDTYLYVNEGTGTWGPTLRLGTRSEITLFEVSSSV